jgi:5-methylcytosine-specific restriction endonuclease McrA
VYIKVDYAERVCMYCSTSFKPSRKDAVFCTRRCKEIKRKAPYRAHKENVCNRCGFIPEDTCQLDVDHIDGNHKNNSLNNLQTLCANCHRLKTKEDRERAA